MSRLRENGTGVISITVKPNPSRISFSAALCNATASIRYVHGIGVDSRGDIYAGLTQNRGVDKLVRVA